MDLLKTEFCIFDVETTGLSPVDGDRIVEIATIKVSSLKSVARFHSLINPEREIPFGASEINGITNEMIADAPKSREVLPAFLEFLGDAVIVGHNVKFDLSFLCYELSLLGRWLREKTTVIDTLKMARNLLPQRGRYPLWSVADGLGIKWDQEHRAMSDAELTVEVFLRLVKTMGKKDMVDIGILPDVMKEFR